uniref:Uncharacterized protein n=1 Tax=Opuntia streptacantha TaxID=393608 RepID=A0A7C9E3V5_OPUST
MSSNWISKSEDSSSTFFKCFSRSESWLQMLDFSDSISKSRCFKWLISAACLSIWRRSCSFSFNWVSRLTTSSSRLFLTSLSRDNSFCKLPKVSLKSLSSNASISD